MNDLDKEFTAIGITIVICTILFFAIMIPVMKNKDLKEYQAYIKETGNTKNLTQDEYLALYSMGYKR